jgi:2-polyprenyl-3-methyl-5-hydroxy-6-metoxy-1,4-benzoquinol methylase
VLIGCLPIYGLHLGACVLVNRLFRLNLIKMYLATNINNPFSAPFLVYLEIQVGAYLRQGTIYEHTLENVRTLLLRDFFLDILVGSLTVGVFSGVLFAALTFIVVRRINRAPAIARLVDKTAHRYLDVGFLRWEASRACLRFDPFYRKIIVPGALPESGSLIHIGCGRGLLLTFLDVAAQPDPSKPGREQDTPLRLYGVDDNSAKIEIARTVLGDRAQVECENIGAFHFGRYTAVANLDQFKSVPRKDRETVLKRAAEAVEPGGVLIIRTSTAQPWMGLWPFTGLTESRVMEILEDLRSGFTTRVLYRSLRRVVILATRPGSDQT